MSRRKSLSLEEIVKLFGGELLGDSAVRVQQVSTLESAGPSDIAFLARASYLHQLNHTRAAAVILGPESRAATGLPRIVSNNPYAYFARVSAHLNPTVTAKPGKHRSAVVDKTAQIAKSASIDAYVVVGKGARLGPRSVIGPGCYIGDHAVIGADTLLYANVALQRECRIGARCIVHSGVVIGSDGFGIAQDDGVWRKIPQIGRVLIGDDVEIGANTTIDRGALDDTVIEDGVKLDNQIQIAHNVRIGAHTAIAACSGVAGSARIGKHCMIGGAAIILGHISLADHVTVSPGTFIMKTIKESGTYTGVYPFNEHSLWLKNATHVRRLHELVRRVGEIEAMLGKAAKDKS